jgi:outer membrane protein assembly factor BamD
MFKRLPLIFCLSFLGGCASLPGPGASSAPSDALAEALRAGNCREAAGLLAGASGDGAGLRLQTAQVCLQNGDFVRARQLSAAFLSDFPGHPEADYAAYVHALAGFGQWSRAAAAAPELRIREGRALFGELSGYLRERPLSAYGDELAPRLVRLADGIAAAEQALAERERAFGNHDAARARARYVIEHYPRSPAAADAARLLMALGED